MRTPAQAALVIGALGVVFGDIGTSPLYAVQTVFNPSDPHPVTATTESVFGIISLIFWAVTIIVTLKYVLLVMRADNEGEGGIMALITLIRRQGVALVPGVSRSGATISAGLFRGFDRVAAARYSFLLSVSAVVLSGLFELRKVGENGSPSAGATAIATLVAFVTGYAAIAWLLRYLSTHTLEIFVVYRIALGVLVLALAGACPARRGTSTAVPI